MIGWWVSCRGRTKSIYILLCLYLTFLSGIMAFEKGVSVMAQISLRVDDDVKRGAEQALNDIGLSMSTAINVFLRKVAREKRIPFELSADSFYLASNMRYLEGIMCDVKDGTAQFAEHDLIEVE